MGEAGVPEQAKTEDGGGRRGAEMCAGTIEGEGHCPGRIGSTGSRHGVGPVGGPQGPLIGHIKRLMPAFPVAGIRTAAEGQLHDLGPVRLRRDRGAGAKAEAKTQGKDGAC